MSPFLIFKIGFVSDGVFSLASRAFCFESDVPARLVSIPVPVVTALAGLIPLGRPVLNGVVGLLNG